jgi:hypothetical protein
MIAVPMQRVWTRPSLLTVAIAVSLELHAAAIGLPSLALSAATGIANKTMSVPTFTTNGPSRLGAIWSATAACTGPSTVVWQAKPTRRMPVEIERTRMIHPVLLMAEPWSRVDA